MILTNETTIASLQVRAPAALASERHPTRTGSRYTFIETARIISTLEAGGFNLSQARQMRTRAADRAGSAMHMLSFTVPADLSRVREVGDVDPRLVLVNSHDGSSAYWLIASLYRFACTNGLMVPMGDFGMVHVPHRGDVLTEVLDGAQRIARDFSRIVPIVEQMKSLPLTPAQALQFAELAMRERFGSEGWPFEPNKLLVPRRPADQEQTLWITMNVIQEHVMRGGDSGHSASKRRMTTRAVNEIRRTVSLNTRIWNHALSFLPTPALITSG